jgi:hypothetical protein
MSTAGKLAPCILNTASNGVKQFDLYVNGNKYGSYPLNGGEESVEQQIHDAVMDAKDYGYDGICFYASNKELP